METGLLVEKMRRAHKLIIDEKCPELEEESGMSNMEDNRLLKPTDIPLIITSQSSQAIQETRRRSTDNKKKKHSSAGGSLKYEIGSRASSIPSLKCPAKWSSVRIKGTGFNESRKSVVKIEPCNGMPNVQLANKDGNHVGLKSPNPAPIKEVNLTSKLCHPSSCSRFNF